MSPATNSSCRALAEKVLEACLAGRPVPDEDLSGLLSADCSAEFFRVVVEGLADTFEPAYADVYARLFSRALARAHPELNAAGLYARYQRVRQVRRFSGSDPARVVVLSRVTIGADIAVTSVILDGLRRRFPAARLQLAGSRKSHELFAADPEVELLETAYPRRGSITERLAVWPELRSILDDPQTLVVDPDSRLTQLGLLPVCGEENYFLFESRAAGGSGGDSLAVLAARWCEDVFGVSDARPYIAPGGVETGAEPFVAVSLGVGENAAKGLGAAFEAKMLARLVARGWRVVLDRGPGGEESERADAAVASLGEGASQVTLLTGSFAEFAGWIRNARLYAGYDSAGQHAAAALGVPVITVFAGYPCERMLQRWTPSGPGTVEIVRASAAAPSEALVAFENALDRLTAGYDKSR